MSQENVEIVRRALKALETADSAFEDLAPDFVLDNSRALGMARGVFDLDQARDFLEDFRAHWESSRYEVDEFIEAGQHVVTPFTDHLRGRDGIKVEARGTFVWTLREGAITHVCLYQDRQEALEAVGLRK